jgi:ubiquinone/menaquinone biosynthesis C-methylase UbiE
VTVVGSGLGGIVVAVLSESTPDDTLPTETEVLSTNDETERVRRIQDQTARRYDRQISFFERILFGGGREWVCSQAHGKTLEIAYGTARNLPHYPPDVALTGVELSPEMAALARERLAVSGRDADLRLGDVQALEFDNETFDTVVSTLTMCTIPDPRRAACEAFRVLRRGGHFLLLEHVRSPEATVRGLQRVLEPLAVRFAADHLLREPVIYLQRAGFEIERVQRSKLGIVERIAARRPE